MNEVNYKIGDLTIKNSYDGENNRILRIQNDGNKNVKFSFFSYYPSIKIPFMEVKKELGAKTWFQPDFKYIKGAGFIEIFIDDIFSGKINLLSDVNLKKISEKIICVGMNKTGTTSLSHEMLNLGYNIWGTERGPYSHDFLNFFFTNNSIGNIIDIIEKTDVDFFQDIPFSCPGISNRIINFFPEAKYILTKRTDSDLWVESVKNFWKPFFVEDRIKLNALSVNSYSLNGVYKEHSYLTNFFETWGLDQYSGNLNEKLKQVYENHNNSVKKTLISNNCDWIEIDVSQKGELKKLTDWLNIENDDEDFVWINRSK
jgi:hypothetical protein